MSEKDPQDRNIENVEAEFIPVAIYIDHSNFGKISYNALIMQKNNEKFVMGWHNTTIKTYENSIYDHLELEQDDEIRGLYRPPEDVVEYLVENKFPSSWEPYPDAATFEWWCELQKDLGAEALKDFLDKK